MVNSDGRVLAFLVIVTIAFLAGTCIFLWRHSAKDKFWAIAVPVVLTFVSAALGGCLTFFDGKGYPLPAESLSANEPFVAVMRYLDGNTLVQKGADRRIVSDLPQLAAGTEFIIIDYGKGERAVKVLKPPDKIQK